MPTLVAEKGSMQDLLQMQVDDGWLENVLFDFGLELEDVFEEDGRTMYRIEIPANRYDLLCVEGLCYALRVFLSMERYEDARVEEGPVVVYRAGGEERPHIACAVVRGIRFADEGAYRRFIEYQDKLHLTIGRNRSLSSMGTHDLDRVQTPIFYKSGEPERIVFRPLNAKREMSAREMGPYLCSSSKVGKYMKLVEGSEKYVYFEDSRGQVLSLPPIINSEDTKIGVGTRDVFIEVTGTNFHRVNTTLKLLVGCFRGQRVESVEIRDGDKKMVTPVMYNHAYVLGVEEVNKGLGLGLEAEAVKEYLERMMHQVSVIDSKTLRVKVHDIRSDVLHKCDLIEDIAIAHGFNNFSRQLPPWLTAGSEVPLNRFSDKLRAELTTMGFDESLTLTLLSREENMIDGEQAVVLMKPKSSGYEVCRTSLIPGLMKAVASNLHAKIPFRVFEVSDVVLLCKENQCGARNLRMLGAVYCGHTPCLEEVQGALSLLLEKCGIMDYSYNPHDDLSRYLKNQSALVAVKGSTIGSIGVCNPEICRALKVPYAASFLEIDVERLFSIYTEQKK